MRRARRAILRALGWAQRPVVWTLFVLSLLVFVGIVSTLWKVDDPVTAGLAAAVLLQQAFSALLEVENELDSEGAAKSED